VVSVSGYESRPILKSLAGSGTSRPYLPWLLFIRNRAPSKRCLAAAIAVATSASFPGGRHQLCPARPVPPFQDASTCRRQLILARPVASETSRGTPNPSCIFSGTRYQASSCRSETPLCSSRGVVKHCSLDKFKQTDWIPATLRGIAIFHSQPFSVLLQTCFFGPVRFSIGTYRLRLLWSREKFSYSLCPR
jgi:hypothetical protein